MSVETKTGTDNLILQVKQIYKHFGRVQALENITLDFVRGEIHTLLGENGAGKSTLMNILYGLYQKDSGEIYVNGEICNINDPRDSLRLGIGMVPQSFKLVYDMSIWENVMIFMQNVGFFFNKDRLKQEIVSYSKKFNFGLENKLDVEIENLSEGEKQKVEILKLIANGSKIMLFDEATNVLAPNELEAFLKVIREMNKQGYTILYITHRLQEALEISDKISVFRKGQLMGTIDGKEATYKKLAKMMIGEEFDMTISASSSKADKSVLQVSSIDVYDDRGILAVKDVSFQLFSGEIVGLAGIEGNGSSHLAEAVMGLRPVARGGIEYESQDILSLSTEERMEHGMSFLPGGNTLVPLFSINKNSILDYPNRDPYAKRGILNWPRIEKHAEKIVDTYNVQTPSIHLLAEKLSGGNKQRLALGRKIEAKPKLLIAYHPMKGLDINSQNFIYERFTEMKNNDTTILFIGTDLDELYRICDRLMVIYRGEIVGTFDSLAKVSKIDIGILMTGGSHYIEENGPAS